MGRNIGAAVIRDKYRGRVAETYDHRARMPKWHAENAAVERWLMRIGPGKSVLDIPVGTGRFLALYSLLGMSAVGMDVSADMLAQARLKMPDADLRFGDILKIDAADQSFDAVVAVRILSWLTTPEMLVALAELGRVARGWIITGCGRSDKQRQIFRRSLPGWTIADDALIERDDSGAYELVLFRRDE